MVKYSSITSFSGTLFILIFALSFFVSSTLYSQSILRSITHSPFLSKGKLALNSCPQGVIANYSRCTESTNSFLLLRTETGPRREESFDVQEHSSLSLRCSFIELVGSDSTSGRYDLNPLNMLKLDANSFSSTITDFSIESFSKGYKCTVPVLLETTRQSFFALKHALVIMHILIPRFSECRQHIVRALNTLINLPVLSIAHKKCPYF
eukprot:TRINITY_DN6819_c0_g3_i4.p1 TRINITY_DN6819_c0_g3~~TRINITY_DN6819_c0_g3_i4.p1  ORF type:complete len:208 (-),score=20.84 TRINITY_DN6819_c0_g3_i4:792-1415(-)